MSCSSSNAVFLSREPCLCFLPQYGGMVVVAGFFLDCFRVSASIWDLWSSAFYARNLALLVVWVVWANVDWEFFTPGARSEADRSFSRKKSAGTVRVEFSSFPPCGPRAYRDQLRRRGRAFLAYYSL